MRGSLSSNDEYERAQRKSRAWKARQAEIAEAAREDAELARARKRQDDAERAERYHGGFWRHVILFSAGALLALLLFERMRIGDAADTCLTATRPHEYGCAERITRSMWFWLLPSDDATLLRGTANGRQ